MNWFVGLTIIGICLALLFVIVLLDENHQTRNDFCPKGLVFQRGAYYCQGKEFVCDYKISECYYVVK